MRNSNHRLMALILFWLFALGCAVFLGLFDGSALSDDAFYYFEIVRNGVLGKGVSFDLDFPTNGFHPLWACLIAPLFWLFSDSFWLPIHLSLFLSLLFTAASAWSLFLLFAQRGKERIGELLAIFWLLNPFSIILGLRGLETSLNIFALSLSCHVMLWLFEQEKASFRAFALLGLSVGFSALARTENILWCIALTLILLIGHWRKVSVSRGLALGFTFSTSTFLMISPWYVWNLVTFGSIQQSSQQAKSLFFLYGRLPPLWQGEFSVSSLMSVFEALIRNVYLVFVTGFQFIVGEEWKAFSKGYIVMGLFALAFLFGIGMRSFFSEKNSEPKLQIRKSPFVLLGWAVGIWLAAHLTAYAWVLRAYYSWYFLPVIFGGILLLGCYWALPERFSLHFSFRYPMLGVLFFCLLCWIFSSSHLRFHDHLQDRYLQEISQKIPKGKAVGLWNTGYVAYYYSFHRPDLQVYNLDGVVNNELVRYGKSGQYEKYLLEKIDFILEKPFYMLARMIGTSRAKSFVRDSLEKNETFGYYEIHRVLK